LYRQKVYKSRGACIWRVTKYIATQVTNYKDGYSQSSLMWNKLLRVCGFVGLNDEGDGIIYADEPTQAVFLQKDAITVLDVIHNKHIIQKDKDTQLILRKLKNPTIETSQYQYVEEFCKNNKWMLGINMYSGEVSISQYGMTTMNIYGYDAIWRGCDLIIEDSICITEVHFLRCNIESNFKCILRNPKVTKSIITGCSIRNIDFDDNCDEATFIDCVLNFVSGDTDRHKFQDCKIDGKPFDNMSIHK
jgi:hypothetical protein